MKFSLLGAKSAGVIYGVGTEQHRENIMGVRFTISMYGIRLEAGRGLMIGEDGTFDIEAGWRGLTFTIPHVGSAVLRWPLRDRPWNGFTSWAEVERRRRAWAEIGREGAECLDSGEPRQNA